ncbi:DUF1853 family protein [Marinobacter sp. DUT-1]|uniref:DUF1853 family protein n=1 Tax=Marinobacter sp. DUT-1 TaxID=3412037 RepID=UPI003D175E44
MDDITTGDIPCALQTPAVRHLAWLCHTPQLLSSPLSFEPARYLPPNHLETLKAWDREPGIAPALLREPPQRRLGFYFERLYQVLLEELLGWEILLKNQQIQSNGRTIGELDFVVHNRTEDRIEHHEIAVKYYLGVPRPGQQTLWYGPNARDRLDLKTDNLIHHQSRRTHQPETQVLLEQLGISGPLTSRIFMPGYLFYPTIGETVAPPDYVPRNHLRGHWRYANDVELTELEQSVPLRKPHWIGPWSQIEQPDAEAARAAIHEVEKRRIPTLFAGMEWHPGRECWVERSRYFVVPGAWPELHTVETAAGNGQAPAPR